MTRTVVVTGANRGIGLSLCRFYKGQGATVYGVCRQTSPALDDLDVSVVSGIDVASAENRQTLFGRLSDVKIDLLINNAGISRREFLGELTLETIEKQFAVNALAPLAICEGLLGSLKDHSKIAIISSRFGSIGENTSGSGYGYRMSKAALNAAGKSMSIDLKPRGIAVGIYHPGRVATDMVGGVGDITPDQSAERLAARIDELTMENTGTFRNFNGETLSW